MTDKIKSKSDTSNMEGKEDINRVIKFRAWDIRKKVMILDAIVATGTQSLLTTTLDLQDQFAYFDGLIWMQFTGITDIEGAEVFEGDIMQGKIHTGVVERGIFGIDPNQAVGVLTWIVRAANGGFALTCDADYRCKDKVIGNKFEHSYLLEQK